MPLPQALVKAERDADIKQSFHVPINSKKRKSTDFASNDNSQPPWRTNSRSSLEDRISYPSPEKRASMDEPLPKSKGSQQAQATVRERIQVAQVAQSASAFIWTYYWHMRGT
ncbi:hypothetical protein LB505_004918 [Fusarium chuoi]|nr:hypothetical protein LB505_004918 [Fusarium chuoi]